MLASQTTDKDVNILTATIANGAGSSDAVLLYGCTAAAFQIPAAFTATSITFLGSIDNGVTFKQVRNQDGTAITYTVAVDGIYPLDKNLFAGLDQLKIVTPASTEGGIRSIAIKPFII